MKRSHPEIVWGKAVNYKLSAVMDEELCRLASCYSALFILPLRPPLGVQIEARKDEYKLTSCHKITHKHSHSTPNCRALQTGRRHTIETLRSGWLNIKNASAAISICLRRNEEEEVKKKGGKLHKRGWLKERKQRGNGHREILWINLRKSKKNTNRT